MHLRTIGPTMVGCVLVCGAVFAALNSKEPARATDASTTKARVLVAPGMTEGSTDVVDLGFRASGTVAEVQADTGSVVEAGQTLARLDDRLARVQLERAQAALAVARAQRLSAVAGARPAERIMAAAVVSGAEADAREAERQLSRGELLLESRAIGSAELDRLRTGLDSANARLRSARAQLELVQEGPRSEVRQQEEAAVRLAEVGVREAETVLADTELRAPCAGTVLRRLVEPGEQASLNSATVAFTMSDLSRMRVRVEIDEQDIGKVAVGQTGWATAPAFGGRPFAGRIVGIMSDLGRVRSTVDDPHARNDTRVLEVVFQFDEAPALPVGLRMDVYLPAPDGLS